MKSLLIWVVPVSLIIAAAAWWKLMRTPPLPEPMIEPTPAHRVVDCGVLPQGRNRVVLVMGQSNAGNHGQSRLTPTGPIYSFHGGRCYAAMDPLPGASGQGGSVWTRLAPLLLQPGVVDAVLLVPWAAGSTSMDAWNRHPALVEGFAATLRSLKQAGFAPDMVLWQQGEMESFKGTTGEAYRDGFARWLSRLRALGVTAPVWVAQATRCQDRTNEQVKAVQRNAPLEHAGVRAGPDMDLLFDTVHRHDGCHFSDAGLGAAAKAWLAAIRANP